MPRPPKQIYKAQFLVPMTVELAACSDQDAERLAKNLSLKAIVAIGDASYPDVGCHALIRESGETVFEI